MKPFSNTLQIMDLVSVYFNNPFFSHFAKLIGKRTSVYSKIISQFLPVKGDHKLAAALLHHLLGKIGKQPPRMDFGRRMKLLLESSRFFFAMTISMLRISFSWQGQVSGQV